MRFLLICLAFVAQFASAESSRVAVVDMEKALFQSDAVKSSYQQFEAGITDEVAKLTGIRESIKADDDKLKMDGAIMSEESRLKAKGKLDDLKEEYQYYARKLQQQEQNWKRSVFQESLPVLEKELKGIIDEAGYELVLPAGAVIYVAPEGDITSLLTERLNSVTVNKD